jgi:uncharacterized protein
MNEIQFKINPNGRGAFFMEKQGVRVAEMEVGIASGNLTVYHTEVDDELKGTGVASKLMAEMITYAQDHKLKVIPLCAYVLSQFKRHPEQYSAIWNKDWHN